MAPWKWPQILKAAFTRFIEVIKHFLHVAQQCYVKISCRRKKTIEAAFLLCLLLLILLNFSNFLPNNATRPSHPIALTPWHEELHRELKINEKNVKGRESAINNNQNRSEQMPAFNRSETKSNSNLSTALVNFTSTTTFGIDSENVKILPVSIDLSPTIKSEEDNATSTNTPTQTNDHSESNVNSTNIKLHLNACSSMPPDLVGPINIDIEFESLASIESRFRDQLLPGGWHKPQNCTAKDRVALVIPYRDRAHQLPIFLKNIHALLIKQQAEYGIYVVEQFKDGLFNRASLMNIGFLEALKLNQWDCFIFHDVDLIPTDDRNLYACPKQPRHMSVAVDTLAYKLPYNSIFGGVSAMTVEQLESVNGFSNSFWGWGGEDDDMSNRLKHRGYHISRYPMNIARYKMLSHPKEKANPKRYEKLVSGAKKIESDGLNSLKYEVRAFERKILYTWILAELKMNEVN